jgi:arsenite-transporting ATPase
LTFAFYGGKGGVGKTTCAAARALAAASRRGGGAAKAAVLVISTDPAHSLGDALAVRLSASPKRLRTNLYAVELDGARAFARWLREHRRALGDVLEYGTWLDRADVESLLDLSLPGIDELVGLIEIDRLAGTRAYDLVVVDTAPTGHTLRLLSAPETVAAVAQVLDTLQEEHRMIRERFARSRRPEAADRLIALVAEEARGAARRLRDPRTTTFHWVTLAEPMSTAETNDAIATLHASGIRVGEVVVNRVLPPSEHRCPVCDRRRAEQQSEIHAIARTLGRRRLLRIVDAELVEPRGVSALARIGARLIGAPSRRRAYGGRASIGAARTARLALSLSQDALTVEPSSLEALRGARLLFFGGKGGVGKTTAAAAAAISLARAEPRQRLLLLSTDPAHSLADVLGAPIGDAPRTPRGVPRNLAVRELDAERAFATRRKEFADALDEIAAAFGASALSGPSSELLDLAPPGIDELFGVIEVVSALAPAKRGSREGGRGTYDTIVVDTAPTGHALRLLETPAAASDFVHVLMRMLLKYRTLARPGRLAAELLELSHSIRQLEQLLRDADAARFIVVTRAAAVPRSETERLIVRLTRQHLATPAIVVNALTLAPRGCPRCTAIEKAERRERTVLRRRAGRRVIIETPLAAPAPRGVRQLEEWSHAWIARTERTSTA